MKEPNLKDEIITQCNAWSVSYLANKMDKFEAQIRADERNKVLEEVKDIAIHNTFGHYEEKTGTRVAIDYEFFIKELAQLKGGQ